MLKPGGGLALTAWAKNSLFLKWVRQEITTSLPTDTTSPNDKTGSPTLGSPAFGAPEKIEAALRQAGLTDIESHMEEHDFVYASDDEWWASLWGHGLRSRFENLDAVALETFRLDMIRKVQTLKQPDGIHTLWHPLFIRSCKPF